MAEEIQKATITVNTHKQISGKRGVFHVITDSRDWEWTIYKPALLHDLPDGATREIEWVLSGSYRVIQAVLTGGNGGAAAAAAAGPQARDEAKSVRGSCLQAARAGRLARLTPHAARR